MRSWRCCRGWNGRLARREARTGCGASGRAGRGGVRALAWRSGRGLRRQAPERQEPVERRLLRHRAAGIRQAGGAESATRRRASPPMRRWRAGTGSNPRTSCCRPIWIPRPPNTPCASSRTTYAALTSIAFPVTAARAQDPGHRPRVDRGDPPLFSALLQRPVLAGFAVISRSSCSGPVRSASKTQVARHELVHYAMRLSVRAVAAALVRRGDGGPTSRPWPTIRSTGS